ncbi:MAG: MFS transporter, partial [Chloroflexota bacterium]
MKFFRSPLFPIFMIVFVDVMGFGITLPVLPLYAQGEFGATATQIALIASVYFLAQFIASPILGRLSDRVGRRPVLILSQAGTVIALGLSAFAPSLLFLYAARIIDGLTGGNISVAQAYLSDITDERNRASGLGIINAAFGSGFVIAPAFGAFLAAQFGPRVPFFVGACISLGTVALTVFLLPESLTPAKRAHDAELKAQQPHTSRAAMLRLPSVRLLVAIAVCAQFAFFSFQALWVLWAEKVMLAGYDRQFTQTAVGGIFTFVGLMSIVAQVWLVKPLVRRFGERALVAGGNLARGFAWALMGLFPVLGASLVAVPFMAIGGSVSQPALIALLTYAAPPGQRGQAIGLLESFQNLGRIMGPLAAGYLFQELHPSAPLVMAALLSALAFVIALGLWRVPLASRRLHE